MSPMPFCFVLWELENVKFLTGIVFLFASTALDKERLPQESVKTVREDTTLSAHFVFSGDGS